MKTCVIMPAYNESRAVEGLVKSILGQNLEIILIDDGSSDNTASLARNSGAIVLLNPQNIGKGASLNKGFDFALSREFDAVVTMDADGQHLPEEVTHFIALAEQSNAGILIGNRMNQLRTMPFIRIQTNKLMSWIISQLCKQKIPDSQCGFRLIRKEVLSKINLKTYKYEAESEILIQAARLGFTIKSIPVKTVYQGEKSNIHPVWDTIRFIRFIIKELWITRH
ncbi:MAG: glycosyltransferase family 2 protein [Candidatus Omnitrophota bacterium]|jgi:glycosyltransferase involved in cell wall biosynthesis